jgi:hypothetical protein
MKRTTIPAILAGACVSVLVSGSAQGGTKPAADKTAAPVATTAAHANEFKTPLAVFVLPRAPQEGRDPFFPKSMRPYLNAAPIVSAPTTSAPVRVEVELKLKARSGTTEHPLALVNNHTFETGEEAEVLASGQRVRIRCLEIRADSVVVQVGPERRELFLKGESAFPSAMKSEPRVEGQAVFPRASAHPPLAAEH